LPSPDPLLLELPPEPLLPPDEFPLLPLEPALPELPDPLLLAELLLEPPEPSRPELPDRPELSP
jgi:hypothetical protein